MLEVNDTITVSGLKDHTLENNSDPYSHTGSFDPYWPPPSSQTPRTLCETTRSTPQHGILSTPLHGILSRPQHVILSTPHHVILSRPHMIPKEHERASFGRNSARPKACRGRPKSESQPSESFRTPISSKVRLCSNHSEKSTHLLGSTAL